MRVWGSTEKQGVVFAKVRTVATLTGGWIEEVGILKGFWGLTLYFFFFCYIGISFANFLQLHLFFIRTNLSLFKIEAVYSFCRKLENKNK